MGLIVSFLISGSFLRADFNKDNIIVREVIINKR